MNQLLAASVCCAIVLSAQTGVLQSPALAAEPAWASLHSQYSATEEASLNEAFDLAKKRRYPRAIRLLASLKSYSILNYPAAQIVCETFVAGGEFKQALQVANELLKRSEKVTDAARGATVKLKADALAGMGELDAAVSNYKAAAKLYPDANYIILCHATELLFHAHRYQETVQIADQAMSFSTANGIANKYKGASLLKLGRPEQAVAALNKSISQIETLRKKKPDAFSTALNENYRLLVVAYKAEGKQDLAAAAQRKVDALASEWNDALFGTPDPGLHSAKVQNK